MKKIAKRQTELHKKVMLYHNVHFLVRSSNSEMLSWPNSPLLVMLQFFDPNELFSAEKSMSATLLYMLADQADPFDYSTHVNQLILAKQLVEHGANVNGVSNLYRRTPLHKACFAGNVTNLDFVEYLLEAGADPNARDHTGMTPLFYTYPHAPGAANFLLNWPTTDANITGRSGVSFRSAVRRTLEHFSTKLHSLMMTLRRCNTNSRSSSGVQSKRCWCWWKGEALIPVPQLLSSGFRLRIGRET
jgi:hypothetical protein